MATKDAEKKKKKGKRGHGEGSIYQRPDGRWTAQVTTGKNAEGKQKRVTYYGKTRKEVQDKLDQARGEIRTGSFVEPTKLTLGEWLNRWLYDYMKPSIRPTTWASYETTVRVHIIPTLGHVQLKKLQAADLQRLYNDKAKNGKVDGSGGLSSRMIHYIHLVVHSALKQALKEGIISRNVSEATKLPKLVYKEKQPFTTAEMRIFLSALKEDRLYMAFLLEFATGLRRGELLALRWQDIDFKKGLLRVRQSLTRAQVDDAKTKTALIFQEPKTKQSKRDVPIPASILAELKSFKAWQSEKEKLPLGEAYQKNDLVFCTVDGRPMDPRNLLRLHTNTIKKINKKIEKEAEEKNIKDYKLLPKVSFHDLRHTFATMLLEMNEHPKVVQEILGHTKISITLDIYSHVSNDLKEQAAARLDGLLTEKEKLPVGSREN